MTRRLFLGPVATDFDPGRDVAAGPWCFVGREDICAEWESLDFVEPFDTPDKLVAAERATALLVDDLAETWGKRLNSRHGLNRPGSFWHRYLLFWLSLSIMATWARWRNMETLIERHGTEPLDILTAPADQTWAIRDFPAFVRHILFDVAFQHWMDSRIALRLLPPDWTPVPSGASCATGVARVGSEPPRNQTRRLGRVIRALMPRLPLDEIPGIGLAKLPLSAFIALQPQRSGWNAPAASRNGNEPTFPSAYLAFLDTFLAETIPDTIGGESFLQRDTETARLRFHPGRLYVANTRTVDDGPRLVAAHAAMAGERLVNAQHGGWEGTAACVSWNTHSYARDYAFLTWGWDVQAGLAGRFVPFVAPQLAAVRNRHRTRESSLVMVGARMPLNGMRFDCVPRPRRMIAYRAAKRRFLATLPDDIQGQVKYRPYTRGPSDLEDAAYVAQSTPGLKLLESDFDAAMLRCRLLVLDHPGTTFHIALAAGVPMICFWDQDDWPLCAEAQPWFDRLEACGVLYRDASAAAHQVTRIWPDVTAWWRSADVAAAIADCRHRFARTGSWAGLRLIRTLWRLNRAAGAPPDSERPATGSPGAESPTASDPDHAGIAMPIPKGR